MEVNDATVRVQPKKSNQNIQNNLKNKNKLIIQPNIINMVSGVILHIMDHITIIKHNLTQSPMVAQMPQIVTYDPTNIYHQQGVLDQHSQQQLLVSLV